MSYAARARPPRTLTDREVGQLTKTMGQHKADLRDRVIISLGLGCGLRESEIIALDVSDVADKRGLAPKRIIQLRTFKRAGRGEGLDPKFQRVHVSDDTFYLLKKYLHDLWKNETPSLLTPLFFSNQGRRLSGRQVRRMFHNWQRRAAFDHLYNFHILRHTMISRVRRETGDLRIAQKQARHVNIQTTLRYEHASDEEVAAAIRKIPA